MAQGFTSQGRVTVEAGKVVQRIEAQDRTLKTTSTTIPIDDTLPQSGEGMELVTVAITPLNADNWLRIDGVCHLSNSLSGTVLISALFQDSEADCLISAMQNGNATNSREQVSFTHWMKAGTTDSTTFKLRGGGHAGTITSNGAASSRELGGGLNASLTVTEYAAGPAVGISPNTGDHPAAIANHVRAGNMQLVDGSAGGRSTFDVQGSMSANTFETVGPTGSGATNIWSELDAAFAAGATAYKLMIEIETSTGGTAGATMNFYAASGDVTPAGFSGGDDSYMASLKVDPNQNSGAYWVVKELIIPCDSDGIFQVAWNQNNASVQDIFLYYKGFFTDT